MTSSSFFPLSLPGLMVAGAAALAVAGCSSPRLWPFGETEGGPVVPENAVQYQCSANKRFFLRMLANGDAWVILPEREFRLERLASAPGRRYSNCSAVLVLTDGAGGEATLTDAPAISMSGCKVAQK